VRLAAALPPVPYRRFAFSTIAYAKRKAAFAAGHLVVTLFADRSGGIATAAKVLALGKERTGKPRIGEEGLGWQGGHRYNLGDQATAFRHINFPFRGPLDPSTRLLVKFADGNRLHMTQCVTLIGQQLEGRNPASTAARMTGND
jgi:hypothetical protein